MNFLDHFQKIVENYTQKIIKISYNKYKIRWPYEDYFKITSLANMITFLEKDLDYKFGNLLSDEIESKIISLRKLVKSNYDFAVKIITELPNQEDQFKQYKEYLIVTYSKVKNFVNLTLIKWIFHNIIHEEIYVNGQYIDVDKYYEVGFHKLINDFLLQQIKLIKVIIKLSPEDSELQEILLQKNSEIISNNNTIKLLKETK
ncbi:hypothetical protein [Spiroplasma alleghenense]|uniref:Uncharacterized protein n=1 Tax=Spiroplasma alleghenense TaxID=216931 RepID=A0A345Z3X3_9MOLU|nr:hypothetical protein [Spiroplasma alleghenense]AXK51302.1 hypothetical protein SALLE_v1c06300 [Spiroplasma alleghenense]